MVHSRYLKSDRGKQVVNPASGWLPSYVHQGHATGSRDIQNGWILSGQPSERHMVGQRDEDVLLTIRIIAASLPARTKHIASTELPCIFDYYSSLSCYFLFLFLTTI